MLTIERISEAGFAGMAEEWRACLDESDAHPLFMSWPWLYSWWQTWSQTLGMELMLLGVFNEKGRLVGIGPFCRRVLVTVAGIRVSRVYMLGNAWRLKPTVRTEYCGLIACHRYEELVREILLSTLESLDWDELVFTDVHADQYRNLEQGGLNERRGYSIIRRSEDEGVCVNTNVEFSEWLKALGKNTRLKAYNRRGYLEKGGDLVFRAHDAEADTDFFELLNFFHLRRWGKAAFGREALRFHRLLLSRLDLCHAGPVVSVVIYNGRCVSVLYDISVRGCRFNLQAGYEEDFDPKVSLGYLHLGFAIEAAFKDETTLVYDLLAGSGKNQFYKSHFRGDVVHFSTFQVVRSPFLKGLYAVQLASPRLMAGVLNRRAGL